MSERREAARGLIVLVAVLVLVQPASVVLADWYHSRWGSQGSAYQQWRSYANQTVPDVLFVGDSRVRADVDTEEIARDLSQRMGRPIRVGSIGIDAAKPRFLAGLAQRVMAMPEHPSLVILAISEYQLNATWDNTTESGGTQTRYFWQISAPLDAAFASFALRMDEDPGRLLAGWVVPLLQHYSVVAQGLRCDALAIRDRTACADEYRDRDRVMNDATRERWHRVIRESYLSDFAPSARQLAGITSVAQLIRGRASRLGFVILPVFRVETLDRQSFNGFTSAISTHAVALRAPLADLHAEFDDRPSLFSDPNHLNRAGARELAPRLAALAVQALEGRVETLPVASTDQQQSDQKEHDQDDRRQDPGPVTRH